MLGVLLVFFIAMHVGSRGGQMALKTNNHLQPPLPLFNKATFVQTNKTHVIMHNQYHTKAPLCWLVVVPLVAQQILLIL